MTTTTTPTAQSAPEHFRFMEKRIYAATVQGQAVQMGRTGSPEFLLFLSLDGQLVDGRNPNSGILPLPGKFEVEVKLRLDPANVASMEFALDDLKRLGFIDEDITRLNPDSDDAVIFKGRRVYVTPSYRMMGTNENCYWNLREPRGVDTTSVKVEDLASSPAAAEFRRLMAERNKLSYSSSPASAPEPAGGDSGGDSGGETTGTRRKSKAKPPF